MSILPLLTRRDIVGRRCVTVNCNHNDINGEPLNMGRGVIRASSHADPSAQDEKVLVEFDSSSDWMGRQWVPIHSQFDVFLVEDTLVGVLPDAGAPGTYQPVLTFKTMVDKINYSNTPNNFRLVEFLTPDRMLNFVADANIVHLKEEDVMRMCDSTTTDDWVCARNWLSFQHGQHVLLSCPSRMIGCRVKVYNIASNSQWYSGLIIAANENTKSVTILGDDGMEHVENATLVQIELDTRDFNVTPKVSSGNVSKPRGRTSTEEHPVAKQLKLDASGTALDFPLKSPSSTSQGHARQLAATPGASSEYNSGTTRPLQVDTGSRNVFSAIMTSQPNQMGGTSVVLITTNPLPVSKSGAMGMPSSATSSVLSSSCSPPVNQADSSKIKTLLGYRPSVMFVIPSPNPTSPGGGTSSATSTPGNCPTNTQIVVCSPGNQQSPGELAGMAGLVQQSPILRLPPGVEYIGTLPLQMRNPSNNSGFFMPEAGKIPGQATRGESLNDGRKPLTAGIHGFHAPESNGSEVHVQSPAGLQVALDTPSRNHPLSSPVRAQGVGNVSGLQQAHSSIGMPRVTRANFVQQVQGPGRMQGLQNQGELQSPGRIQGVQTTGRVRMPSPITMPGVQSANGMQQLQSQVRVQGVQSATLGQQSQSPSRITGIQSATLMQQSQSPSRITGIQSATLMQSPSKVAGVENATGMRQMQSQVKMQGVQSAALVQQIQSPSRLQEVRMPGVQNVGLSQQHPAGMQSNNVNQPYAVRNQGMQGSVGVQQMPGPCRFQAVQGVPGNQQSTPQFQGVQSARGIHQGPIRSDAGDIQQSTHLLNSGACPPGQSATTAKRMPVQTRFQMSQYQDQASILRPNTAQPVRGQNSRVRSPTAGTLRLPVAPVIRGMQRPAVLRCQTSSLLRSTLRNQTGSLRPGGTTSDSQQNSLGMNLNSQASSQEIVHQIVEGALRKYGLEMNCRMTSPATQRLSTMSSAKSMASTPSSASESCVGLPRSSDLQVARQDGSVALGGQNSGQHALTIEPFTLNSLEISNVCDSKPSDSHSNLKSTTASDAKYLCTKLSSSTGSMGSLVQAQGNPTPRARQVSKISKSRAFYYDSKSDSHTMSIEFVKGKTNMLQPRKTKANDAKRRAMPQQTSALQPLSMSSRTTSSDLLPLSKLETPGQDLKGAVKNVSSTGVDSGFRATASSKSIGRVGGGTSKMWFEEYEDELQDLSRILDMLKRLDSVKCRQVQSSAESEMPAPKLLSDQMNSLLRPVGTHLPDNQCSTVIAPKQKSHCETKVKQLQEHLRSFGLKFENPSFALSKKKLNPVCDSANGVRTCIQDKSCLSLPSLLLKCRECKSVSTNPSKLSQVLCRFHAFRRLTLTGKGSYVGSGFSSPTDADGVEISLWMPLLPIVNPQIDVEMAKYIIKNVGNRFCELVEQEKEAMSWITSNGDVAWKRAVNGVREMCDVCNTTLFNVHWVCRKCGYVACLDCYRTKTHKCTRCHDDVNCATCDRGCLRWAKCSANRQPHDPKEMMLTQIIPSDVLWVVGRMIHDIRKTWRISENCPCGEDRIVELSEEPSTLEQVNRVTQSDDKVPVTDSKHCEGLCSGGAEVPGRDGDLKEKFSDESGLKTESEVELKSEDKAAVESNSRTIKGHGPATLREFLLKKNSEFNGMKLEQPPVSSYKNLDDIFRRVMKEKLSRSVSKTSSHPSPDSSLVTGDVTSTPVGSSSSMPQEVAHVWLDNGRLLQLLEPRNPGNLKKFQEVWRKGQPVMFSNCDQYITKDLWTPGAFAEEFGEMENDLVDCSQKVVLLGHQMRHFWQGFECVKERLKDSKGKPMILKLKDWPPTEDFSEMLPTRFEDLLQGLPLPEYTHRSGVFNLASRLPEFFVRPDLGPKMYNAYGSALHPLVGSTNLHLDVSDAVNLILYVGIPMDDTEDHETAAIDAMKKAGCCDRTLARTTELGQKPGALWHIFDAKDSDKIRDLLTKVGLEIGEPVEAHHDPIHDQSWYLDENLRERLLREYSVQGYTIVQFAGDAIFIPAGAPHQVRNLHSCIKAAEDFVSPENLSHCFKMTQEFRHLSDTHSNHEDKLQVKNIIYHAVKDAIAVLQNSAPDMA